MENNNDIKNDFEKDAINDNGNINNSNNNNNNNDNEKKKKKSTAKTWVTIILIIILFGVLVAIDVFSIYLLSPDRKSDGCNGEHGEYNNHITRDFDFDLFETVDKPIIYLYPTKEIDISVKLLNSDRITCSYPKYKDMWNVHAKPNGDLKDLDIGKNLYSLYYENVSVNEFNVTDEGFVVKGEDSAKFLEEKLSVLGLTDREAEEFIVYWLPKLESNKYNYIRFATEDEINNNMAMEISPKPDTLIRVLMTFKGLDNPIEVKEQKLDANTREGYTVVEWGGTEIK